MKSRILLFLTILAFCALPSMADPGMWLFNAPPSNLVKAKYGFLITQPWLDHLRLSSLRFDNGGSGSFVSADGLAFTNHHVAADCLQGLSSAKHNYVTSAFYARTRAQEHPCPNLELNQLLEITDVTKQVNADVKPGMSDAQVGKIQRAAIAKIEKDCSTAADIRCDVVTLYAGAIYNLYKYKRYTDIRLVFAPEFGAAFFGGDPDNFEYPRYDLDIAFFRVYENGRPVQLQNYLHWSRRGVKDGDLVFVSGNPGATSRDFTMNHLMFLKNVSFPWRIDDLHRRLSLAQKFSAQSADDARIAQENVFGLSNAYKAISGFEAGLNDANLIQRKKGEERRMLVVSTRNPAGREVLRAYKNIDSALETYQKIFVRFSYLELDGVFRGRLADYARTLVRAAEEKQKPNAERLPGYRDSSLPSLEQDLFSTAPVYKSFDTAELADSLAAMQGKMGASDPVVQKVLNGKTPEEVAQAAIAGTQLDSVAFRKQLYAGGEAAVAASNDPMIVMMRTVEPEARALRKQFDDEVDSALRQNYGTVERFRFTMGGLQTPPDATFTLRLSYGPVKGYVEDGRGTVPKGATVRPITNFAGAFQHAAEHGDKDPYALPPSWFKNKSNLDLKTPLNFVSTADIIGGNSGSPVVNENGHLVGIIFDSNIQALPWNFLYDDTLGRAVSVDSRGIIEALRKIYHANGLANELTGAPATTPRKRSAAKRLNGAKP